MNTRNLKLPDDALNVMIRILMAEPVNTEEMDGMAQAYAKLFPSDTPKLLLEDVEHVLERDGTTEYVTGERVVREWYMMKIGRLPAYMIVKHIGETKTQPDIKVVTLAVAELVRRLTDNIRDAQFDPHAQLLVRDLQRVSIEEVGHIWTICKTYGLAPWGVQETVAAALKRVLN